MHWSLARSEPISRPRWGGTAADTRIAYLAGSNLRVVGGDGKSDRLLAANVALAAPAWIPAQGAFILAYSDRRGVVHFVYTDFPARFHVSSSPGEVPTELRWTASGTYLLALAPRSLRVLSLHRAAPVRTISLPPGPHALAVAPRGDRFVLTRRFGPDRSEVVVYDLRNPLAAPRRPFAATGDFTGLEWSPDGRWLLVAWPTADQWLFVRPSGRPRTRGVARVAEQFSTGGGAPSFPALGGWCCAGH